MPRGFGRCKPSPRRSLAWAESRQKCKLPPGIWGIKPGTGRCCRRRPLKILTWTREKQTDTAASRSSPLWQPSQDALLASAREPPLAPPARPPSGPITSRVAPGSHVGEVSPFPRSVQPAAFSRLSSSPPAQWEGTLTRLRTLGKAELDPAPFCCFAPLPCVRGTSGAAPSQLPLVTGEAGGGGGGTRREDGECEGLGPSGAGRSPASLPLAQGRALRLKTGGNGLALSLMSGSWIGFGGRQGVPSVGPGENLGLGRKAELATCPKLGEGAGRVLGCRGTEPGLHHYSGDWDEGGSEELRRAASARRIKSSQGIGLPVPQESGVHQCPARSGEKGQRCCL